MTKLKKALLGCVGLYIFAALSLVQAQGVPPEESPSAKMHSGEHIQEIYSQLNLTDDQKKQLDANKQQHRARTEISRQELKKDKEALRQEIMSAQLDMVKINKIHQQIKDLQAQMEDDKLNSILAVRAILTPEQFLKFINLMHKHKSGHDQ
jgi:Spy/CpxP family protein refolding chaperone